jgi:hypothetical protein
VLCLLLGHGGSVYGLVVMSPPISSPSVVMVVLVLLTLLAVPLVHSHLLEFI